MEKSKRTEHRLGHKKQARPQTTVVQPEAAIKRVDAELARLQQQLKELETAAAQLQLEPEPQPQSDIIQLQQHDANLEGKFKVSSHNIFCYWCGEGVHMATDCNNPPNKKLVQEKVDTRKRCRQQKLN